MQVSVSGVHVWHFGLVHLTQSYVEAVPNRNVSKYPAGQEQSESSLLLPKHSMQVAASGVHVRHLRLVHLSQLYVEVVPKINVSINPSIGQEQSDGSLLFPKH